MSSKITKYDLIDEKIAKNMGILAFHDEYVNEPVKLTVVGVRDDDDLIEIKFPKTGKTDVISRKQVVAVHKPILVTKVNLNLLKSTDYGHLITRFFFTGELRFGQEEVQQSSSCCCACGISLCCIQLRKNKILPLHKIVLELDKKTVLSFNKTATDSLVNLMGGFLNNFLEQSVYIVGDYKIKNGKCKITHVECVKLIPSNGKNQRGFKKNASNRDLMNEFQTFRKFSSERGEYMMQFVQGNFPYSKSRTFSVGMKVLLLKKEEGEVFFSTISETDHFRVKVKVDVEGDDDEGEWFDENEANLKLFPIGDEKVRLKDYKLVIPYVQKDGRIKRVVYNNQSKWFDWGDYFKTKECELANCMCWVTMDSLVPNKSK